MGFVVQPAEDISDGGEVSLDTSDHLTPHICPLSPNNRADLRAVKVNLARTVILLSAMVRNIKYQISNIYCH